MEDRQTKEKITFVVEQHVDLAVKYLIQCENHPSYTINTVIFAVVHLIRRNWTNIMAVDDLISKLIEVFFGQRASKMGIRFFENLVSCIKQYIYASGYIEYRKIMVGFQRHSLEKIMRVTSNLMKQEEQLEEVINLFYEIGTFNFTLSFYDIEGDNDQRDNQAIPFPDYYNYILYDS